jgi:hypothetical protein
MGLHASWLIHKTLTLAAPSAKDLDMKPIDIAETQPHVCPDSSRKTRFETLIRWVSSVAEGGDATQARLDKAKAGI